MKKLLIMFFLVLLSTPSIANSLLNNGINIEDSKFWGDYIFKRIDSGEVSYEWTFNNEFSTLIIIKSECSACTPFNLSDVNEINKIDDFNVSAVLISHKYGNGIYQIHKHPKNIDFFVFKLFHKGFYYKFQLGVNSAADQKEAFEQNIEFLKMINIFTIS